MITEKHLCGGCKYFMEYPSHEGYACLMLHKNVYPTQLTDCKDYKTNEKQSITQDTSS